MAKEPGQRGRAERERCHANCSALCSCWPEGRGAEKAGQGRCHDGTKERAWGGSSKVPHHRASRPQCAVAMDKEGSRGALPRRGPPHVESHDEGQVRACDVHATAWRRGGKGRGRKGDAGSEPATCVRHADNVPSEGTTGKNREGQGQGREGEVGREKRAAGCGADRTREPGGGKVKGE